MSRPLDYERYAQRNVDIDVKSVTVIILESSLGWTPTLWSKIHLTKDTDSDCFDWSIASLFFIAFLVDFVDAVFDLILAVRTTYFGTSGDRGLGILLLLMTILGRVVSAIYGVRSKRFGIDEEGIMFIIMELTVFLIEDGAAILVLASDPGDEDLVENLSMYLTAICGLGYCLFLFFYSIPLLACCCFQFVIPFLILVACVIFEVIYFFKAVVLTGEDDEDSLRNMEVAAYAMYGVGVIFGLVTFGLFVGYG